MHIFREGGNLKLDNNDFILKIVAELEQKGIKTGYDKLKKELEKDPAKIDIILNTSGTFGRTRGSIKKLAAELHNELSVEISKLQKQGQNINFDLSVGDVEEVIQNVINHTKKLEQNFDSASAKAQKFLAQFNKKSGGVLINSAEFKAVQTAINGLGDTHTIDDLNKSMNTLENTYNNMVSSLRNSGKSLNPFINAKNEMAVMDETIKGIGLEFEKLSTKPKSVADSIKQLSVQQAKVNSYTIGTQEWADAYGQLQKMIQKVNAEISNLSKAKSANVATHIFNTEDLDKQGKIYLQKISNTIEKTKSELESKLRNAGYSDINIKGVEDAKGKIKSLTATVTDATGAFKQLNFERAKIQGSGKAQAGFIQTDDVKVIGNISSEISKVQNSFSSLKTKWEEQGVLVGEFKAKVDQLESSLSTIGSKNELNGLKTQIQELKSEASTLSRINEIQLSMDNGYGASEYQNRINAVTASLEKYGVETQEAKNITASLQSTFDSMKGLSGQELVIQADKLEQEFKAVKVSVEQAKLSYDKLMQPASKEKISSTLLKAQKLLDNNTKVTENVKNEWQGYVNRLSSGSDIAVKEINDINIRLKQTESSMRSIGKLGLSWTDKLKQAWEKFGGWGFATGTMMTLYDQIRKIPKEVYEIDTAMTNLYKVTDETSSKYNQFLDSSSKSAHELGRSISSLVEQTANWAKLGFSLDEAEQLAKISSIYANVGEVDNDTAVSDMVTAMKAFNIEASESITIVDKLNKLGNEYATSAAALGDGLSHSASAMATSGTDINKTLAMLTGGTEITQNASEFGNFLKVGSMRIRGMKGELEALGEEVDETVDSISKVQTQILNRTGGKVNIFDDMGNFRDYYDIMEDISEVYDDLNDPDKADLTEILFGKQRGNQGAALIQAFQSGQIQKALEATLNAEGSAMQEQERWLESLEAKIQQFEAAFQSLSSTILDSGLLKWFVDFGTGTVKVLDTIVDKLGSLGTILTGVGIFGISKNVDYLKTPVCPLYI